MRRTIKLTNRQAEYNPTKRRGEILRETLARLQPTLETRTAQTAHGAGAASNVTRCRSGRTAVIGPS
jgi:hypothetical protein